MLWERFFSENTNNSTLRTKESKGSNQLIPVILKPVLANLYEVAVHIKVLPKRKNSSIRLTWSVLTKSHNTL